MFQRLVLLKGYRELVLNFVLRDVKEKYRGTILGYFWTLITPLLLMAVFILIFTYVFPIRIPHYPVYLLTGLLVWNFFSAAMADAVYSIRNGAELLKKVYFPPEVCPVSAVITNSITFCLSLLVLVPFLAAYKINPTGRLLWLPGIILWQALFCCGLGMLIALSHVFFRDTGPLIGAGLNIWFYATPIFYTTDFMPERIKFLYFFNPTAVMVDLYRWSILAAPLPMGIHLVSWAVITLVLLLAGVMLYTIRASNVTKVI